MLIKEIKDKFFEEYKKLVEEAANKQSKEFILNEDVIHAQVVIENLFLNAKKNINIFSGELNPEVYSSSGVVNNIKRFLEKKANRISILLQNGNNSKLEDNAFVKLCRGFEQKCQIKMVNEKDKNRKNHFITVDGQAYRFEPDNKKPKAIACFNDKKFSMEIDKQFKILFGRGNIIPATR